MWSSKEDVKSRLTEKRALPTGVKEFHEWADRIISGTILTATPESQKFALANTLLNLSPTTAFEADLYFVNVLRKHAVNQVADAMRTEIRDAAKKRLEQEQKMAEVTPPESTDGKVLENPSV